jgi:alkanesulfonate monooxygenase SsuD/methylene tetrahydromethanopterin reductase-like flavin-dependent oxidoreductase (luciferase family)
MQFGYFTLSDNHYSNNPRSANQCITDIVAEAIHAERVGLHSAWIGEHHFSTLGVTSCPDIILAHVAAKTQRIRLAPAVNVLPLHHPIRVAEQWATLDLLSGGRVDFATGRGYDRNEYGPLGANFEENAAIFAEGLDVVHRLWTTDEPISHHGKYYRFDNVKITPSPLQRPLPIYVASFSRPSIELAARMGMGLVVSASAAQAVHGGLTEVARLHEDACAAQARKPGKRITSYFMHFADNPKEELAARERQLRYHQECTNPALPGDAATAPANYQYFVDIVARRKAMKPEDLTSDSVLLGNSARIIDTLKAKVDSAGFDEVILYFGLGLKPHAQVKDEMSRFMEEVAPAFSAAT